MVKYLLKIFWRNEFDEVTKEQYLKAQNYAGVHVKSENEISLLFQGNGILGKIKK